ECDTNAFAQVAQHDLLQRRGIDWRAVDGVAFRRVAAVGPIQHTMLVIDLEINRLRQAVEKTRDVAARRGRLPRRHVDPGPKDPPETGIVRALLRPVKVPARIVDGDADAPPGLIAAILVGLAGLNEDFDVGPVDVRAHHAHAFAIAPIELAV